MAHRQNVVDIPEDVTEIVLTADSFRRMSLTILRRVQNGQALTINAKSNAVYILTPVPEVQDFQAVSFRELRNTDTWKAMETLMQTNNQEFVLTGENNEPLAVIKADPVFQAKMEEKIIYLSLRSKLYALRTMVENIVR